MENEKILDKLRLLKLNSDTQLEKSVISIVLDECDDDPINYIKDVINNGCMSGAVSALIYYSGTRKFFIDNMDDIFEFYNEYYYNTGIKPFPNEYFKLDFNNLSLFAFGETLKTIANELGLEV